jgi:hypothetical protein
VIFGGHRRQTVEGRTVAVPASHCGFAIFRTVAQLGTLGTHHHLSGGAQGPDPVQALLQDGPPEGGQLSPNALGSML